MIYLVLILMTIIGAFGGYYFKKSTTASSVLELARNFNFYMGTIFYIVSSLLNIIILRYLPYSIVLPLTSITYIWTAVIGHFLLNEKLHRRDIAGIGIVVLGAMVLVL